VTAIGVLFIAVGVVALGYHLHPDHIGEITRSGPLDPELFWVVAIRLLAIVGGALLLRGSAIGRWLLVGWMAYHLGSSALHTWVELVTHAAIFIPLAVLLFHRRTSAFMRPRDAVEPPAS
jgi:hypothetical protein